MLGGSLATTAWRVLGLRLEGWPPALEDTCECISSRGQTTRDGPPAWVLDVGLTTPHHKNKLVMKSSEEPRMLTVVA
jgi:hypothetical protein